MAKTCQKEGCNNPVYSHLFCRIHQWLRTDDDYKRQKEYAKENRKAKKKIPAESKKRRKEHIRYLDQVKLYKQEKKDKGEYCCYICHGEFEQSSIDLFPTIHHTKGRSGDYYLDKQFWMLAHNKCHLGVFHGWSVDELKQLPYWKEFLARLQNDYPDAYAKIMKQINKSGELF